MRARASVAAALVAALLAGCAGVDPFGPQPLGGAAQSAVQGRGNVNVRLDEDGVAWVSGWVEDGMSERAVLRAVERRPEVLGVVSLLRVERWPLLRSARPSDRAHGNPTR